MNPSVSTNIDTSLFQLRNSQELRTILDKSSTFSDKVLLRPFVILPIYSDLLQRSSDLPFDMVRIFEKHRINNESVRKGERERD